MGYSGCECFWSLCVCFLFCFVCFVLVLSGLRDLGFCCVLCRIYFLFGDIFFLRVQCVGGHLHVIFYLGVVVFCFDSAESFGRLVFYVYCSVRACAG